MLTYWVEVNSTVTSPTKEAQNTLVLDILNSSGTVVQTVPVATAANNGTSYVGILHQPGRLRRRHHHRQVRRH